MGHIFRNATGVLVWLGYDEEAEKGLRAFSYASRIFTKGLPFPPDPESPAESVTSLKNLETSADLGDSLKDSSSAICHGSVADGSSKN